MFIKKDFQNNIKFGFIRVDKVCGLLSAVGPMHILYSGGTVITRQISRTDTGTMPLNYLPIFKMEC